MLYDIVQIDNYYAVIDENLRIVDVDWSEDGAIIKMVTRTEEYQSAFAA